MRGIRKTIGQRGQTGAGRGYSVRFGPDQVLPDVRRPNRKRRGLRPNDVQTVQTRVLLVLFGQS